MGDSQGGVWESYAAVQVSGRNGVGGLVGDHTSTNIFIFNAYIAGSYATGDVAGTNAVGGLAGSSGNYIRACYATGERLGRGVSAIGSIRVVSSVAGVSAGWSETPALRHSTKATSSAAMPPARCPETWRSGGLVGTAHPEIRFFRNYWDLETSGVRAGVGGDDPE